MELIGGLNHGAVSRQKKLWSEVPAESVAGTMPCSPRSSPTTPCADYSPVFQRADELLSPQRNYSKLTTHIDSLPRDTAVFPYLGIYLKELALINAGNPSFLDDAKTKVRPNDVLPLLTFAMKINTHKAFLLGRCVAEMMRHQEFCQVRRFTLLAC